MSNQIQIESMPTHIKVAGKMWAGVPNNTARFGFNFENEFVQWHLTLPSMSTQAS